MIIINHHLTAAITADTIFQIRITTKSTVMTVIQVQALHGMTMMTGIPGIRDLTGTGTAAATGIRIGDKKII